MEQRRKIVIPTTAEPIEEPHFDTEATLSARPVVPLTESVAAESYEEGEQPSVTSVASAARRSPLLLVLLIAAAALAGAAGALAIDYLRNPQHKEAEVTTTVQPSSSMNTGAQPVAKPTEELKTLDEVGQAAQPPVVNRDDEKAAEKDGPAPASKADAIEKKPEPQPKASAPPLKEESSRKEAKESAKSAKPREKSDDERADDEREQRRQQRREQRRARIVDEYNPDEMPAGGRRRKEGVTRIRDIFEGSRP